MGGAATNSGIDFQSRVGALAMVSMFAEVHELTALGLADPVFGRASSLRDRRLHR